MLVGNFGSGCLSDRLTVFLHMFSSWITRLAVFHRHANINVAPDRGIDFPLGGAVFYDCDFKRGCRRLGLGAGLQSGALHTP